MEQAIHRMAAGPVPPVVSGTAPLSMARPGEPRRVQAVRGKEDVRRFLTSLGFTEGAEVTVLSEMGGNVIVRVKDARVAISRAMASKIYTL